MKIILNKLRSKIFLLIVIGPYLLILTLFSLYARFTSRSRKCVRIVFGPSPILNSKYWNQALKASGYCSATMVFDFIPGINKRDDWDIVLREKYKYFPDIPLKLWAFAFCLIKYDIFVFYNSGSFLGSTPLWRLEHYFLKLARRKTIVFSHGGDSYVYGSIRSSLVLHGLLMSYPDLAKKQTEVSRRVDYWRRHADLYFSMVMVADGIGRSDIIMPSYIFVDGKKIRPSSRHNPSSGGVREAPVVIAHCPNHSGFKGTEFIEAAVAQLKEEGLNVSYVKLEKVQNDKLLDVLMHDVDILADQLLFSGYALNATEALAAGLVVVANMEDEHYLRPMRLWSFLGECPIVSSTPESVTETLRKLVQDPVLRHTLALAGRQYFEKYHDLDSGAFLFERCFDYLYGDKSALTNIFHPSLGAHQTRLPKITHPLINSRLECV